MHKYKTNKLNRAQSYVPLIPNQGDVTSKVRKFLLKDILNPKHLENFTKFQNKILGVT
jgi:hypothetical protein